MSKLIFGLYFRSFLDDSIDAWLNSISLFFISKYNIFVMYLESFIPSEETYQAMLNVKSLIDEKFGKKGQ